MTLEAQIQTLFEHETSNWELAKQNYQAQKNVRIKEFDFGDFRYRLQFNPGRIISSTAKIDWKSIQSRPCFLCEANRPTEQQAVSYKDKYDILVNPYPILPKHFTLASKQHEPQLIRDKFDDMLDLANELPQFVLFYNGPKAGASAPDHFHFQAGNAEFFNYPIELPQDGFIRKISHTSANKKEMNDWFFSVYKDLQTNTEEPMMNLFCQKKGKEIVTTIFPRKQHRPRQFFAEGAEHISISPGSIDMSGTLIVTRLEDFEKIDKETILDIFEQL